MKPIYEPKGKAKEYGDYAINIYTGCPHRCYYCFAPNVLHKDREKFHCDVRPREGLIPALEKQLQTGIYKDKLIHLCFTCDPFPMGVDTTPTLDAIRLIKQYGGHIQILTKGLPSDNLFSFLDNKDWYGVSLTGAMGLQERNAADSAERIASLFDAKEQKINTWISFEPVLNENYVLAHLLSDRFMRYVDKVKIGKLNYYTSDINWKEFGEKCEAICIECGINYMIKDGLREEMNK